MALTTSALALQSLSPIVHADVAPEKSKVGYRYTNYTEDDLDVAKKSIGSVERYEIDVHQFHLLMPVASKYSIGVDVAHETMSGASPWFVQEQNGAPVQAMSGATISEERNDVVLNVTQYRDKGTLSAALGISDENDYTSYFGSIAGTHNFDNKHRTFSWAVSYSDDDVEPTQRSASDRRVDQESKGSGSLFAGFSQVIDKVSVAQIGMSFTHKEGYLSDPYKEAEVEFNGLTVRDNRPNSREQWTLTANYRRFLVAPDAALHLDYRFYSDDWGIDAHTFDVSWLQNIGKDWQLIPTVRYYTQTEADFYDVYYLTTRSDHYYSSDYRLSGFGSYSFELKGNWKLNPQLSLTSEIERYISSADYALNDVESENPGLVDFTRFTVGFDFSF